MKRKPTIAIVGAGNLGAALAQSLVGVGYRVTEIICRDKGSSQRRAGVLARKLRAHVSTISHPALGADVVWFCVPDREIRACALSFSRSGAWDGKLAFHSSGALSSDELKPLREKGAKVASVHPLMTFVHGVRPPLAGVPFAIEGDSGAMRVSRQIVRDLGGAPFPIAKKYKPAYHAFGAFASPLLIAALVTTQQVARAAGMVGQQARARMLPIVRQTITNYAERGAAAAFSGPLIRGDADTVRKHLEVLEKNPVARDVYIALARSALRYLPTRNRTALARILGGSE